MSSNESGSGGRRPLGSRLWDQARRVLRIDRDRAPVPEPTAPVPTAPNQERGASSHLRDQSDGTTVIGTVRSDTATLVDLGLDHRLGAMQSEGIRIDQLDPHLRAELAAQVLRDAEEAQAALELTESRGDEQEREPVPSSRLNSGRAGPADESNPTFVAFLQRRAARLTQLQSEREGNPSSRAAGHAPDSVARFAADRSQPRGDRIARAQSRLAQDQAARRSGQEHDGPNLSL
jgi:hypothetical protein